MKKRPFKKKLEYRSKHPYPFKRLKFEPTPEFVDALGFLILKEGIQVAPAPPNLIEFRHMSGVEYRGPLPLFGEDYDYDDDEPYFDTCGDCDLPDACTDFGCAIKQGLREPNQF
jgi:hypothetical protein